MFAMWNGVVPSICENVMMTKDLRRTHPHTRNINSPKKKMKNCFTGQADDKFFPIFLWSCFFYLFIYCMFLLCRSCLDVRMARWCIAWYVEWGLGINNRSAHICALYFQFSILFFLTAPLTCVYACDILTMRTWKKR